jgi:hypothetical protein
VAIQLSMGVSLVSASSRSILLCGIYCFVVGLVFMAFVYVCHRNITSLII